MVKLLFFSICILMTSCSLFDQDRENISGVSVTGSANMEVFVVPEPISNYKILPFTRDLKNTVKSDTISITATRNSYEPASFIIRSIGVDLKNVIIQAEDLKAGIKGGEGRQKKSVIPSENIAIKIVKCWYQAGTAGVDITQSKKKRILIPELLLNDDSLIKVDYENQENYLKLSFPEGEQYVWISDTTDVRNPQILSAGEYPVKDSPMLLPVDIPAGTNKQFWITVRVPNDIASGTYEGKVHIQSSNSPDKILRFKLLVLPFDLSPSYHTSSIYYRSRLDPKFDPKGKGTISSEYKTEKQFRKELEDLLAHGVTNPTVYESFDKYVLGLVLKIRDEIGMGKQPLYYLGLGRKGTGNATTQQELDALKSKVKEIIAFCRAYGVPEVYFYGIDEGTGDILKSQKASWNAVHEAGGKVFVAGYKKSNFEAMGDTQDLLISAGALSKTEAETWHSKGHKIWSYANPQGGVENPELYRRNFGLQLWKNDYDGACTYAYQSAFGNIWNDFDHPVHRDIAFTYPTADGVIDTIAWEGYREGIDDLRYLTTLLRKIEIAKALKSNVVEESERYIEDINIENNNLYHIREVMISYIMKLDGLQEIGH